MKRVGRNEFESMVDAGTAESKTDADVGTGTLEGDATVAQLHSYDVLGVPVTLTSISHAAETIRRWAEDKLGRIVCLRDVHGVMLAQDDPDLMAIHRRASLVAPDGMPLVILGRLRGHTISRTSGPDLMEYICAHSAQWDVKHYLYGGWPGVAEELASNFSTRFPGFKLVGVECPPSGDATPHEDADTVRRIVDSGADIVWVGLPTPKQEYWMDKHVDCVPATLIGVGAAFDIHAGRRTRAPLLMQKMGLEWLYRLMAEPRRLWWRYLVLAPRFLFLLVFGRANR